MRADADMLVDGGEPLTGASDLFAVGVMLYELTVGYHPFAKSGATPQEVMAVIRAGKPAFPEYVDKALVQILKRALAPELNARYPTAGEFAGQLLHYALDHGQASSPEHLQSWLGGELGLLV